MKKFMAVYTGNPDALAKYSQQFPDEAKRRANDQKGMEAWMKWGKAHGKASTTRTSPSSPATASRSWSACRSPG